MDVQVKMSGRQLDEQGMGEVGEELEAWEVQERVQNWKYKCWQP